MGPTASRARHSVAIVRSSRRTDSARLRGQADGPMGQANAPPVSEAVPVGGPGGPSGVCRTVGRVVLGGVHR